MEIRGFTSRDETTAAAGKLIPSAGRLDRLGATRATGWTARDSLLDRPFFGVARGVLRSSLLQLPDSLGDVSLSRVAEGHRSAVSPARYRSIDRRPANAEPGAARRRDAS